MTEALWGEGPPQAEKPAVEGLTPPPASDPTEFPPLDAQRRHCGRPWCRCTHDNGCEFGWVDVGRDRVKPCPQCQPDRIQRFDETRGQWLARLRKGRK